LTLLVSFSNVAYSRNSLHDHNASAAGVLLGPCGVAGAHGPSGIDDDFTNRSIDRGIALTPDSLTTAAGTIEFRNTVENIGAVDDAFIITVPSRPPGFTVELSTDFGDHYLPLDRLNYSLTLPVSYHAARTFFLRVTAPAGLRVLTSFDLVIRATSTIDPEITNETIDRVYTGFIRLDTTATVINRSGSAHTLETLAGTEIEFAFKYSNISSAIGIGSSLLTAQDIVIYENGCATPNNWGFTTDHVVGASDNQGGYIVGDREGSTSLTDRVMSLDPGQSGVFKFRRRVK